MFDPNETLPAGVALLAASTMLCPARGSGAAVPLRPSTLRTLTSLVHSLRTEIPLETPLADPSSYIHPLLKSPHITTDVVAAMRSSWLSQLVHREETFAPNLYLLPVDDPAEYEEMTLHFDAYTMTGAFFLNRYDAIGNIYEYLEKFFPKAQGNASAFGVAPALLLGQQWAEAPTTTTVPSANGTSAHRHPCDQRLVSRQTLDTFRSGRQLRFPEFLSLVADCTMSLSDAEFHSAQLACRIVNTAHVELDELRSRARMALYRHNEHREPRGLRERMDVAVRSLDAETFSSTSTTVFPRMLQMLVKDDTLLEQLGMRLEVPQQLPNYQLQSVGGGGAGSASAAVAASRRNRLALVLFLILESFPLVAFASRRHVGVVEDYLAERSKRRSDRPSTMFEEYGDAFAAAVVKFAPLVFPVELKGSADASTVQLAPLQPPLPSTAQAAPAVLSPRRSEAAAAAAVVAETAAASSRVPPPQQPTSPPAQGTQSAFRSPPRAAPQPVPTTSAPSQGGPVPHRMSMDVGGEVIVVSPYRPRQHDDAIRQQRRATQPPPPSYDARVAAAVEAPPARGSGGEGDSLHWWPSGVAATSTQRDGDRGGATNPPAPRGASGASTAGQQLQRQRPEVDRHDIYGLDALRREFDALMAHQEPLPHEGPRGGSEHPPPPSSMAAPMPAPRVVSPPRREPSLPRHHNPYGGVGQEPHRPGDEPPLTREALERHSDAPALAHRSPMRRSSIQRQHRGASASPTRGGRKDPRLHPAPLREPKDSEHHHHPPSIVVSPVKRDAQMAPQGGGVRHLDTAAAASGGAAVQGDAAAAAQRHNDWMRLIKSEAEELRQQQRNVPGRVVGAAGSGARGAPDAAGQTHHQWTQHQRGAEAAVPRYTHEASPHRGNRMVRLDPMAMSPPTLASNTHNMQAAPASERPLPQRFGQYDDQPQSQPPQHQQQRQEQRWGADDRNHLVQSHRSPTMATVSATYDNEAAWGQSHRGGSTGLRNDIHVVLPGGAATQRGQSAATMGSEVPLAYGAAYGHRQEYSSSRHKRLERLRAAGDTDALYKNNVSPTAATAAAATMHHDYGGGGGARSATFANMHVVLPSTSNAAAPSSNGQRNSGVFRDATNRQQQEQGTSGGHRKPSRHEELLELEALIEREKLGGMRRPPW